MTSDKLTFRRVTSGATEEIVAEVDEAEFPAGELLRARTVWLKDGTADGHELSQHRPADGQRRQDGYDRLDNEILAGRRLHKISEWSGYPAEVACLYGDQEAGAEPYTLFEPSRGDPLSDGATLFEDELDAFVTGLLRGLCWLAGAGIAHRAISPATVYWDGESVLITDFSRSAPFGSARVPVTGLPEAWVSLESRPVTAFGVVGPTDDVWAATRLIYFVRSRGEELEDVRQLDETGLMQLFNGMLAPVFGPPEGRPQASDLLRHGLRRSNLLPALPEPVREVVEGRQAFLRARDRRHPGLPVPGEFWADLPWAAGRPGPRGPQDGGG